MVMPGVIGYEELQTLTGQGAQLAEVLPAEECAWAHLPGAAVTGGPGRPVTTAGAGTPLHRFQLLVPQGPGRDVL